MISRLFTRIQRGHVARTRIRAGEQASAEQSGRTLKLGAAQDVSQAREQWNVAEAMRERD